MFNTTNSLFPVQRIVHTSFVVLNIVDDHGATEFPRTRYLIYCMTLTPDIKKWIPVVADSRCCVSMTLQNYLFQMASRSTLQIVQMLRR